MLTFADNLKLVFDMVYLAYILIIIIPIILTPFFHACKGLTVSTGCGKRHEFGMPSDWPASQLLIVRHPSASLKHAVENSFNMLDVFCVVWSPNSLNYHHLFLKPSYSHCYHHWFQNGAWRG